jgi:hypothetical protein
MDDPGTLQAIVTSPTGGAGAGVLTWAKTNWLKTAYAATAPQISADPQSETVQAGSGAAFIVVASGSAPLTYQWYFNTNTLLPGATGPTLSLSNVQNTNAGTYSVMVSNNAGTATSAFATLSIGGGLTGFAAWQSTNFTSGQLANPSISGPGATPAGDGVPNLVKYALGLQPFTPAPQPLIGFRMQNGEGVLSYSRPSTTTDVQYVAEVSTDLQNWTTNGESLQLIGTGGNGLQNWEAHYSGAANAQRYFRLKIEQ